MQMMLVLLFPSQPPSASYTSLGSSEDTQLRGHLLINFPPHRSTGEAYPRVYLGSVWCRAQPRSLGTRGSVSRLHGSPCALVGLYHLVPEDTPVLFYLLHKPPSSPLKIPAKVSFMHFLASPHHNWLDWFENAWWQPWPRASLFEDSLTQGMSQCPGQRGCALLAVHPAIHPAGTAWIHPLSSCRGQWRLWVKLVMLPRRNLRESRNYFGYFFLCPSICGTGDQALASESHQQPGWQDKGLSIKKTSSLTPADPELHSSVLV